jgi:deferrochelatase/peroxidase EfeB
MIQKFQRGIYYNRKPINPNFKSRLCGRTLSNDTFALLFLRVVKDSAGADVKRSLVELWKVYDLLQKGVVSDIPRKVSPARLSVLIAYGPKIFELPGVMKSIPDQFKDKQFLPPSEGGNILDGCGIKYSKNKPENVGLSEEIVIQFISRTQLATYRAIKETWNYLNFTDKKTLKFSKFYTGFQRDDYRSWLGFHDELSNMRSGSERKKAIFIDPYNSDLRHKDYWTAGGTYLAFLRTEIDFLTWEKIDRHHQELIVGREKNRGMPLIGVDKLDRPVFQRYRNNETQIGYNPIYHDHPNYFDKPKLPSKVLEKLDMNKSVKILSQSHIGRTRHFDGLTSDRPSSRRIFRQGFEFFDPVYSDPTKGFSLGINFISFQNDPARLFFIITDPNWMGGSNFGGDLEEQKFTTLLSVLAAGIFFVPPMERTFPGVSIFD